MGSLMAGWNCSVPDSETARLERNKSLTRGEIESFWKVRRMSSGDGGEEQEEQALQPPVVSTGLRSPQGGEAARQRKSLFWQRLERSKTFPGGHGGEPESPVGDDKVTKLAGDWWTRSNWAFLNEPPHEEMDESSHKYTAQFHVAGMASAAKKQQVN